jgi:hypothetical protein
MICPTSFLCKLLSIELNSVEVIAMQKPAPVALITFELYKMLDPRSEESCHKPYATTKLYRPHQGVN